MKHHPMLPMSREEDDILRKLLARYGKTRLIATLRSLAKPPLRRSRHRLCYRCETACDGGTREEPCPMLGSHEISKLTGAERP